MLCMFPDINTCNKLIRVFICIFSKHQITSQGIKYQQLIWMTTFLFQLTKFQKWIWSVCQGNNSAIEACCELPAQIFQEAEGLSNREAAVAHGHVGYTL